MKKHIIFYLIALLLPLSVLSQTTYRMGTTRTVNAGCGAIIVDNGGPTGNYGPNRNDTITIFSNDAENPFIKITLEDMDIHESDTLFLYDSDEADPDRMIYVGPLYAPFFNNSNTVILGDWATFATITNPSGAITLRFKSDGANQGSGFKISCECLTACQRINTFIDPHACLPPLVEEDGIFYANVCEDQSVTLVGYGEYIDNDIAYNQTDETSTFIWEMGDTTYVGVGLSSVTHTYLSGRGYDVNLFMRDERDCINFNSASLRIRTSLNPIRNIATLPDVCSGTNVDLAVGYGSGSAITVDPVGSIQESSLSFDSTMHIPDGPNCDGPNCYNTYVTFASFPPGKTLQDVNDLYSICMTIEHSYIGDLDFTIICPNGQSVLVHPTRTGGGLYLGQPIDDYGGCNPTPQGTGWNYCWSENTSLGYGYHGSSPHYIHQGQSIRADSTNRVNHTNYYRPLNSFTGLIGCPLNGTWNLQICDTWGADDGWIFGWELNLSPNLLPTPWTYTVLIDEVLWSGSMITATSDSTAIIETPEGGEFLYTFTVIDDFGCAYDSTLTLNVVQSPEFDLGPDISMCSDELITIVPNYDTPNATYTWSDGTTDPTLTTAQPGTYTLTITESNGNITCSSTSSVMVNIFPQPIIDFTAHPLSGCSPLFVEFQSNLQPSELDVTYYWDFGDPYADVNTSNDANPAHIYHNYGTYDVGLRVVSSTGCEDEIIKPGFINVHATPLADFIPNPAEVSLSDNPDVFFNNTTENYIPGQTYWNWSFGDGGGSDEHMPTHTYQTPGDYVITLVVSTGQGCGDTISKNIVVEDEIFIPNIITPDGDGHNDVFVIGNINPNQINKLKIYNRWGKKVYEQSNYKARATCIVDKDENGNIISWNCNDFQDLDTGWTGAGLSDGVYYYTFVYSGATKTTSLNGTVTILR